MSAEKQELGGRPLRFGRERVHGSHTLFEIVFVRSDTRVGLGQGFTFAVVSDQWILIERLREVENVDAG